MTNLMIYLKIICTYIYIYINEDDFKINEDDVIMRMTNLKWHPTKSFLLNNLRLRCRT